MAKGAVLHIIYSSVKASLFTVYVVLQEDIFWSEDARITECVDIQCLSEAPSLKILGASTLNLYRQKYSLICDLLKPGNTILWSFRGKICIMVKVQLAMCFF